MKFEDLANHMLSSAHQSLGTGATNEEIEAAAHALGLPISGGYRKFLERFGWGTIGCDEFYGLGCGVDRALHLVAVTENERTEAFPPLPNHLLPVWNNGGGDLACLDTQACPGEPPMVMWWHEDGPDQLPQPQAPNFVTWLAKLLAERAR